MTPKVEFHFDFGSPNAYFSHKLIPGIEQRTGAKFVYVPILLGGVFKAHRQRRADGGLQGREGQARLPAARDRCASSRSTGSRASR